MHSISVALFALFSGTIAAPTLSATFLDVTNLQLHFAPEDQSSVTFNLRDRSPTANDTVNCSAYFSGYSGVGTPIGCTGGNTSYSGSIDRWNSFDDFLLHFKHSYHEPSVGVPDYLTVFANAVVNSSSIVCIPCPESDTPSTNCAQPTATVIKAPITSMIAKK